jgi:hypothetical protein
MNGVASNAHRITYDPGLRERDDPRPDLHSLVFNVKFREEMWVDPLGRCKVSVTDANMFVRRKATFLAKSSQFQLRRMDSATFDAITRTETGAWSAAVVSAESGGHTRHARLT